MSADLNLPDPRDLEVEDIPPAIAQLAGLQTALAARLITERRNPVAEEDDTLLTVKEAAALLNTTPAFLYKRAKTLPFTKHIHRRGLRFSKRGIVSWLARRR